MRTDEIIMNEGFSALLNRLDIVEVERFIAIINRDKFDYTQWRKVLWEDLSVKELSKKAMDHYNRNNI